MRDRIESKRSMCSVSTFCCDVYSWMTELNLSNEVWGDEFRPKRNQSKRTVGKVLETG